jgi:hypothetical protein
LKLGLAGYQEQPHPGVLAANITPVVEAASQSVSMARRWLTPCNWRRQNEPYQLAASVEHTDAG